MQADCTTIRRRRSECSGARSLDWFWENAEVMTDYKLDWRTGRAVLKELPLQCKTAKVEEEGIAAEDRIVLDSSTWRNHSSNSSRICRGLSHLRDQHLHPAHILLAPSSLRTNGSGSHQILSHRMGHRACRTSHYTVSTRHRIAFHRTE